MDNYTYTYADACKNITTQWRQATQFFRKIYLSLYLKGLCVRGSWRLNKDCNILTSPAPPDIAVCLSRSPGQLNRGPGAQLSAESLFSQLNLEHCFKLWNVTAQSRVPRDPSAGCCFLYSILSSTDSNFLWTELYCCFTPTQSLPITGQRNMQLKPSLEWHVWSSSSGNNCHAVHRSPSAGASVCDCTVGF